MELRSYDGCRAYGRHEFAQLVLPVSGTLQVEIEGQERRLDPLCGAVVPAEAWHSQCSTVSNQSLILDIDQTVITEQLGERLFNEPFTAISPAARKLVEFMHISLAEGAVPHAILRSWIPLLMDTLVLEQPQTASRLAALLAQIEANPALPWTTESMAKCVHMSVSRLHTLFREELGTSPAARVLQERIKLACRLLGHTNKTIAEVALLSGFSDQTALTRALRHNLDITPGAYRRIQQETGSKRQ